MTSWRVSVVAGEGMLTGESAGSELSTGLSTVLIIVALSTERVKAAIHCDVSTTRRAPGGAIPLGS